MNRPEATGPVMGAPLSESARGGLSSGCVHCGQSLSVARLERAERFCCRGCETVHGLLQARGWADTYSSLRGSRAGARVESGFESEDEYLDLDREPLLSRASIRLPSETREMRFYLEGAHCAACVWLTEKVGEWVSGTESVRLDLESGIATARIRPGGSFAKVARELAALGYRPRVLFEVSPLELQKQAERRERVRIAVLAAIAGNLMLFSVPLYAGLEGELARVFSWISGVLFVPALVLGGGPFYRSAWGALRRFQVGIDLPIALGTTLASAVSYANLFRGSERIYFDSTAGFLLLLLASRAFLKRAQQAALQRARGAVLLIPETARLEATGVRVRTETLQRGQRIRILPGESVPVDGIVQECEALVSAAWLTGESRAIRVGVGETLFAGTVVERDSVVIELTACGAETRLGKLLEEIRRQDQERPEVLGLLDRVGRVFAVIGILGATIALLSGLTRGWEVALQSAVAAALVACPCAFGLTAPLIFSRAMAALARVGIVARRPAALERAQAVRTVAFDKTGTLTEGALSVIRFEAVGCAPGAIEEGSLAAMLALELRSVHPVARAIVRELEAREVAPLVGQWERWEEVRGWGVAGILAGQCWELHRDDSSNSDETCVILRRDGEALVRVVLGDRIRSESREVVGQLRALGHDVLLLSGDRLKVALAVASQVGIRPEGVKGALAPEAKLRALAAPAATLFVGDGANDALVLQAVGVGVALNTGIEASLRAADFAVIRPRPEAVLQILRCARGVQRALRGVLGVSLVYNLVALTAAVLGKVSPLLAAVLMPASSLLALGTALLATQPARLLGREAP